MAYANVGVVSRTRSWCSLSVRPVWRVGSMSVLRQSCCLLSASVGKAPSCHSIMLSVLACGCLFIFDVNLVNIFTAVSMQCTQRQRRSCSFCVWGRLVGQLVAPLIFCRILTKVQHLLLKIIAAGVLHAQSLLLQIFNGVFLKVNKATINMLRRVEPYVAYGYVLCPCWVTVIHVFSLIDCTLGYIKKWTLIVLIWWVYHCVINCLLEKSTSIDMKLFLILFFP